jgi:CRP-like cAMP-binding protein
MAIVTRFVVDACHRGTTISFGLMASCCRFLLDQKIEMVFLACAPHLINLYLAFGFRTYARNFSDPDVGFVVPMMLPTTDIDHLKAVHSPLLAWRGQPQDAPAETVPCASVSKPTTESAVKSEQAQPQEYWAQVYALLSSLSEGQHHILDGLTDEQSRLLLDHGHLIECAQGELIIKKGARSSSLFIVMSGAVEVRDGGRVLAVLGAGEVLGEIGFLLASPRTADVYAASERVRILSTDEKTLRQLIELNPKVSARFLLNLAKSLCFRLISLSARPFVPINRAPVGQTSQTNPSTLS